LTSGRIADLLVKHLVKDGRYSVIERQSMDKILANRTSPIATVPIPFRPPSSQTPRVDAIIVAA